MVSTFGAMVSILLSAFIMLFQEKLSTYVRHKLEGQLGFIIALSDKDINSQIATPHNVIVEYF